MSTNHPTNIAIINYMKELPSLYQQSPYPFWDDEHISKGMLQAHIDTNMDAASRPMDFIVQSVDWITQIAGGGQGKRLLDLGCGPGLYADLLTDRGFQVTGLDFSKRSIAYAQAQAAAKGKQIDYFYQNYLTMDYENAFDLAILIYCDFGVLSPNDRELLLNRIYAALKPGGMLILDAWNKPYLDSYQEKENISYSESGFWSPKPHVLMERAYKFIDTGNTLEQYLVITNDDVKDYYIWNQCFSVTELTGVMRAAGFRDFECFDDVTGADFTDVQKTFSGCF